MSARVEKTKNLKKKSTINGSDNNLSISPKDSGRNAVPLSVLETMFEKAKSLMRNDCLVLEKLGAADGSYIVVGSANRIFCVSSEKGGSFKCDRSCINSRTKSANMSLQQQKNVESANNSWSGLGDQNAVNL